MEGDIPVRAGRALRRRRRRMRSSAARDSSAANTSAPRMPPTSPGTGIGVNSKLGMGDEATVAERKVTVKLSARKFRRS